MGSIIHRGNPVATILDEVISARGSQVDLGTRLGNGMNADGSLQARSAFFDNQSIAATLDTGALGFTPQWMFIYSTDVPTLSGQSWGWAVGTATNQQMTHDGDENATTARRNRGRILQTRSQLSRWQVTQFNSSGIVIDRILGSETINNVNIIVIGLQ